nr:hypothetical protein [Tanacetum cinerariifolium]
MNQPPTLTLHILTMVAQTWNSLSLTDHIILHVNNEIDLEINRSRELLRVYEELTVTVHHRHNFIMELSRLPVTPLNEHCSAFLRMLRG